MCFFPYVFQCFISNSITIRNTFVAYFHFLIITAFLLHSLLKKAVLRNDRWRFRSEYKHLQIDSDKWFSLRKKMQKAHIKKVLSEPLPPVLLPETPATLTLTLGLGGI